MKRFCLSLFAVVALVAAVYCLAHYVNVSKLPMDCAAVLPLALVGAVRPRRKDDIRTVFAAKPMLSRRYGGISICLANEDAAAGGGAAPEMVAANALKILDASGHELPIASRAGAEIHLGNASAAMAGLQNQQLSTFACGYPTDQIDDVAQFLAPYVEAPVKFSYSKNPKSNVYLAVEDDAIGASGLPQVILPDPKTMVDGTLIWRGLETQLTDMEAKIAAAIPGGSLQMEEEDRTQMLVDATRRGRLLRIISLYAVAAGGATGKNWDETADPILDLRGYINTVALECGGRQNVSVLIGSGAWEIMVNQIRLAGGSTMPRQVVNLARVAEFLEIPAENIKVSYLQVVNSKQGKTTTTTGLLTTTEIYVFGRFPNPSRRDAGCAKTFAMRQGSGWYEVYSYQKHPKVTGYGLNYYELTAVTNSAAVARLNITNT